MRHRLAAGLAIVLMGGIVALFSTVYTSTYLLQGFSTSGHGNFNTSIQGVVLSYYLYPVWSPPTPNRANYSITACAPIHQAWYTPLNPAPSCLPPFSPISPNYTLNAVCVILVVFSVLALARTSADTPKK